MGIMLRVCVLKLSVFLPPFFSYYISKFIVVDIMWK
jgi:hypothetical protein